MRLSYGMSFVIVNSDACSASITVVLSAKSYDIGPCYNGIWLYNLKDDEMYCQTSNISHTLLGNEIVDHSDVGAAPTTSSFST